MAQPLTEQLAPAILGAEPPSIALEALKLSLLDFLACAFEAREHAWSRQAATIAARCQGTGTSSIVGTALRAGAHDAALANAVAGHALVREDMHAASVSHLGVVVLPAMLALAQSRHIDGARFASACIVGYEVGARIGRVLVTPEFRRRWRPTGFTGPLAVAAAGARLLALSPSAAASALALAANTACGLNQWPREGGEEMFFHPGVAARNGMLALELAELGAYGSPGALDGEAGLLTVAGVQSLPHIELFEAGSAEIMAVFRKPLPVCNFAQTPCQVANQLVRERRLSADAIGQVSIRASEAAVQYPGCDNRGPFERVLQAKMSIPYCVAAALVDGEVSEASFRTLNRPQVLRLIAATSLAADPVLTHEFPRRQGAQILVRMKDGNEYSASMPDLEPASAALIESRFVAAARPRVGTERCIQIQRSIRELSSVDDIDALMRLTEADPGANSRSI